MTRPKRQVEVQLSEYVLTGGLQVLIWKDEGVMYCALVSCEGCCESLWMERWSRQQKVIDVRFFLNYFR